MKIKHLIIVGLLLAIITMGAASASEDIASDDVAASNDDSVIAEPGDGEDGDGDEEGDGTGEETGDYDDPPVYFNTEDLDWNTSDDADFDDPFIVVFGDDEYEGTVTITCDDSTEVYRHNAKLEWDISEAVNAFDISFNDMGDDKIILFNSKNFTIAFNNNEGISASQTYLINHVDEDDYNIIGFEEYDPDPVTELPDFYVSPFANFDVNDPDAAVLNVRWEDDLNGTLWVEIDDGSDRRRHVSRQLAESEKEFIWTVSDLEIGGIDGHYSFVFYYYEEDEDAPDWDDQDELDEHIVGDEVNVDGRNYNDFWADINHNVNHFSSEAIVTFYCAGKSEGTVDITVYRYLDDNGDDMILDGYYHKDIADNEGGYLYWNRVDLELEYITGYLISLSINDWEYADECFIIDPVQFSEMAYLNSTDEGRIGFVYIQIPDNFVGKFNITINEDSFSFDSNDFEQWDETTNPEDLYWYHPRNRGIIDTSVRDYVLNILNIENECGYEFTAGDYDVNVVLKVHVNNTLGENTYERYGEVKVVSPTVQEEENATIIIYDSNSYHVLDDEGFIQVITDDEYFVVVTLDGSVVLNCNTSNLGEEGMIAPVDLGGLLNKTYDVKVSVLDNENNTIAEATTSVTFEYGEEGIMWTKVIDPLKYEDEAITVGFVTDKFSGNLIVKIDGQQYFIVHLTGDDEELSQEDDGWLYVIALDDFSPAIYPGVYDLLEILYVGDDGTNAYSAYEDIRINPLEPRIEVYDGISLSDDDVVIIYPGDDDSEVFRIVILMDKMVYLDATNKELGLKLKPDSYGNMYYAITPEMLDITLFLGDFFETMEVYYSSEYYNVSNEDEGEFPSFYVEGMLKEVEYGYDGPVVSVYCYDDDEIKANSPNFVTLRVRINDNVEKELFDIYSKNTFVNWTLDDLDLKEGDKAFIEAFFDDNDDDSRFGGEIWVVNNTEFRVKSADVLFSEKDDAAVFVFCPEGSEGKTLIVYEFDSVYARYTITKADEGNYVTFSMNDLGIDDAGFYEFDVNVTDGVNDTYLDFTVFQVIPFAEFNANYVVAFNETEDDRNDTTRLVTVSLPYGSQGGISIFIDGVEVYGIDLSDMEFEDYGYNSYTIYMADLHRDISEGFHEVNVAFGVYSEVKTITFAKRNAVNSENASVEMFSVITDIMNHDAYFAVVTMPDDYEYTVYIGDVEVSAWIVREDSEDSIKTVYLGYDYDPNSSDNPGWGKYNVTVVVSHNGAEVVRNNATLTLISPQIFIAYSDSDENVRYGLNNDTMINIYPNGDESNFYITVIINGEVYLDATLEELNLVKKYSDDTVLYYTVGPANFQKAIEPGTYQNVSVYYTSQYNYRTDNIDDGTPDWFELYGEKMDPDFKISIDRAEVQMPLVVTVTARPAFNGVVTVKIRGQDILVNIVDGKGTNESTGVMLPMAEDVEANLTFEGNEAFNPANASTTFNMTLHDPHFVIFVDDIVAGNPAVIGIQGDERFEGNVNVSIYSNGVELLNRTVRLTNGTGSVTIGAGNFTIGSYVVSVYNPSNPYFLPGKKETTFEVTDFIDPDFKIVISNVNVGDPIVVSVTADDDFRGYVNVVVEGYVISVFIDDGEGFNDTTGVVLAAGDYKANITFEGNNVFKASNASTTFKVFAIDPNFVITIPDVEYGNPIVVTVTANKAFTGNVNVLVAKLYLVEVSIKDGYGINETGLILPISGYIANLYQPGSGNFTTGSADTKFDVTLIDPNLSIAPISDIVQGNTATVKVSTRNDFSGAFKVLINGNVVATGNIVNGVGSAVIPAGKLSVGTVTVTVTTDAHDNFTAAMDTAQFKVKTPAKIVAKDRSVMYTSGAKYSITVYGVGGALAKNVQVVIKINGKKVATVKTNSKGVATYKIVQKPGTYKITAQALGKTLTKKLTVKHVVKLPKVKVKRSAKKLIIKVTLNKVNGKYLKKKKVTLKFKGKKYVAKTNKKGVAKFTIKSKVLKKLKKGKKVTYQATYLKDTVKRTVKVRK